jgi:uncharacterized protein involved in outer membrane biogenesis
MRKVKLILISLCGVLFLFLVLVAVLIFTIDEDNLAWTLSRITEYRIEIGGPLSLDISMNPSLSVSDIKIRPHEQDDDLFSADIGHIRTMIALKPLLSGTVLIRELDVSDVQVSYVEEVRPGTEEDEETDLKEELDDFEIPILESVTLENINVSYLDKESDYSLQVLLHIFNIDDVRDTGPLYVKGSGTVNKTTFSIDGQLGSVSEAIRDRGPYPVDLGMSIADLRLKVSGTINDILEMEGLNLLVTADEAELSNMLEILKADTPRLGYLDLDADVTGDIEAPRIADLTLKISGESNVELSIKGSVGNLLTGEGTDIAVSGLTSSKDIIQLLLPEDFHSINELELSGTLRNSEGNYLIDNVRIDLKQGKEATIKARGSIFIGQTLFDLEKSKSDLKLNMEAKNTELLKSLLFDWLPDTGPVTGQAWLTGSLMDPDLKDINIAAGEAKNVWINAQGRVGSIPIDPELPVTGIDISLSIKADEAPQLFANLGIKIPELDDVYAEMHMHGSGERLIFDGIAIQMIDPEGVTADVSGNLIMEEQDNGEFLDIFDLDVNMTAPTVASFRRLLAAKALPDLGPVKLTCNLKGTDEVFSIENLLLQAGHPGPVRYEWRGRIGNVVVGGELPTDVQIDSKVFAERTSLLSPYIGFSIPDFGQIKGTSKIVARKGGYGIDDFQAVIGSKVDYVMKATGVVAYVMRGTDVAFDGIDVSFELRDLDSKIISDHVENELLNIGKINGSLSVSGNPEDLSVSQIEFRSLSPEGLKASIHGGVQHIRAKEDMPFEGINIELAATTPDMSAIKGIEADLPDLGPLNIKARINDRDNDLNVETFLLYAGPEKEPTFFIEGRMNDILSTEKMDIALSFEAATKPWVEELYGHRVPEDHRVKGKAAFTGSRDHMNIVATAASGKTHINTTIDMTREIERRRIDAHISAPKVYLDDLGIYPELREREETAKKDKKSRSKKIFSDEPYPFPEMKDLDLSFRLDTEEVIGSGFILKDFDIDVVMKEGLMLIGPARITYADGFMSMESTLDMRGPKPEIKLNLKAEDIDTEDLFLYAHSSPMILGGHLNLFIDLQSTGNSPREIASALNGYMEIAIESGEIKRIADLMGADAIDLVADARKLGTYQKLNCLVLNFNFKDGIGNSQVIYMDTPSVRSLGEGTVNLKEETLKLVIQPKPKRGQLGGSSPVTIKGPLNNPSAKKLPLKEAARLSGEILMPFVFLPVRALGYVGSTMKDDKDEQSPCLNP